LFPGNASKAASNSCVLALANSEDRADTIWRFGTNARVFARSILLL
jgi:hypothetical protein